MAGLRKCAFVKDENGSATIEAVLWLPIFLFIILLVFDVSMTFYNQSQLSKVTQTASRHYAVGQTDRAKTYLAQAVSRHSDSAVAGENYGFDLLAPGIVQSWVSVRAGDLGGVGLLKVISGARLTVHSHQMIEGWHDDET